MNRIIAGLTLASAAVPAAASEAATMRFACSEASATPGQPPELAGLWDVLMDVGGNPQFGLLTLGMSGTELAGSIAFPATGVVVVRSLTFDGRTVTLIVASREGDVRFDGSLAADGARMCGIVSYHRGQKFEMIAQKRADRG